MEMVLELGFKNMNVEWFLSFNPSSNGNGAGILLAEFLEEELFEFQSFF